MMNIVALTVTMSVDSALATSTNTSASRQYWSIHSSRLGVTSTPGLSTSTTSSRSSAHSSRGQYTCTSEHSLSRVSHSACPSWLTDWKGAQMNNTQYFYSFILNNIFLASYCIPHMDGNLVLRHFVHISVPHSAKFWRQSMLSGATQCRAFPRHQSKEMEIFNIYSNGN